MTQAIFPLRWTPVVGFSAVVVAGVGLGLAVAALSPSMRPAMGVLVAAVTLPMISGALAHISRRTFLSGGILFATAGLYAVVLHHSPDITALELILLLPALVLTVSRYELLVRAGAGSRPVRLFVFCSLGLLLLNAVYAIRPSVGLPSTQPLKELLKNAEIFLLAAGVYCYVDAFERLARVYALLLAVSIVDMLGTVVATHGHLLSGEALQTAAPLWVIALVLPFVRRATVAGIGLLSLVVLVFARTRGAWIGLFVIAVIVLLSRRFRWALGRRGQAFVFAAAGATVLLVVMLPALFGRVSAVVSGRDQSTHDRLAMDQAALTALREHPLTGIGPGEFKPWLLNSPPIVTFQIGLEQIPQDPHDVFAKFGAEMGLPGLLLFAGWSAAVLAPAWRFRRVALRSGDLRPYGAGLSFLALVLLLHLLTAEWSALSRLEIALSAGALLSLTRAAPEPEPT